LNLHCEQAKIEELETALATSLINQQVLQENLTFMLQTLATLRDHIDEEKVMSEQKIALLTK
jgi:hypothetical protein